MRGVLFLVHNFTCLYLNYNSLHNASVVQLHSQYTCTEMILHAPLLYIYFARINSFYFWVLKGTKEHVISHMIESKGGNFFFLFFFFILLLLLAPDIFIYLFYGQVGRGMYIHICIRKEGILYSHFHFNVMVKTTPKLYFFILLSLVVHARFLLLEFFLQQLPQHCSHIIMSFYFTFF